MHRKISSLLIAVWSLALIFQASAADTAGGRIFDGLLDGNHDGRLDTAEISRMPRPFRTWLSANKMDTATEGLSREDFLKIAPDLLGDLRRAAGARRVTAVAQRTTRAAATTSVADINKEIVAQAKKALTADATGPVILRVNNSGALPSAYRALDKNGDGQLVLPEWTDKLPSEFLAFDQNKDGFLSPRELGATPSSPSKGTVSVTGSSSSSSSNSSSSSSETKKEVKVEGVREDVQRRVNAVFPFLDKDKDGSLTQAEWEQSKSTRSRFEKAEVTLTFPISQEEFSKKYQEVTDKLNSE
jgi:Ca2+-binding EF-hand superfamily protein